jgi:hypothetical protein
MGWTSNPRYRPPNVPNNCWTRAIYTPVTESQEWKEGTYPPPFWRKSNLFFGLQMKKWADSLFWRLYYWLDGFFLKSITYSNLEINRICKLSDTVTIQAFFLKFCKFFDWSQIDCLFMAMMSGWWRLDKVGNIWCARGATIWISQKISALWNVRYLPFRSGFWCQNMVWYQQDRFM